MKLVSDLRMAKWLAELSGEHADFNWDVNNRTKNRKHGIEQEQIESLFRACMVFIGRIVEPAHNELRWLLLGQDDKGRYLTLIFTFFFALLRPICCRSMRRKERELYDEAVKSDQAH